jgi:transcription termination factor Rho
MRVRSLKSGGTGHKALGNSGTASSPTALIDTASRRDEVIFEEFKSTG